MVAVIHEASSIRRALNYNENKVKEGVAVCLDAPHYLKNASDLSFNQKLSRLKDLADLRESTGVNTLHVSLNFDVSEKLSDEKLRAIALDYMAGIGFEGQPYLLYKHLDAGHPHVHIVSTNIRPDGTPISLHYLGIKKSEPTRKALEKAYGLVRAEDRPKRSRYELTPAENKAEYGLSQTKRAVTGILRTVLKDYKFTSLAELNAVLRLYNVTADRGGAGSRTYQTGGLVYRILKDDGTPVGTPIKASAIFGSPTLKKLEGLYPAHEKARQPLKKKLATVIDFAFARGAVPSLKDLAEELQTRGIDLIERRNSNGILYGITYVDHGSGAVFNGSNLGKDYGAAGLQRRLDTAEEPLRQRESQALKPTEHNIQPGGPTPDRDSSQPHQQPENSQEKGLLESLLEVEQAYDPLPYELSLKSNKKRKRKGRRI